MKTKVLLFGMLADIVNQSTIEIEDVKDTDMLLKKVRELNGAFIDATFLMAVNNKIVLVNQLLKDNDEVALLPPYAGG